jgi:CheY-like chemotaxis protein
MALILLADDKPEVCSALARMLRSAGHEVLEAADGDELLRVYEDALPELVICDIYMPGKDGLEVIRELLDGQAEASIIAMSGGSFMGHVDMLPSAKHLGAAAVLYKPIDQQVLIGTVSRVLEQNAASRQAGTPAK